MTEARTVAVRHRPYTPGPMAARFERWMALTGVVAVVLWLVGVFVIESASPGSDASAFEILEYFDDDSTSIFVGGFLFALGTAFFVWFLGILRAAFLAAEGQPGRLTAVAFAGGVGKAVFDMGVIGGSAAGAIAADEADNLTPQGAQALFFVDDAFFIGAEFMALVFMAAAGALILSSRALPVWLGWLALVIALGLLVVPIGWAFLLFGVPLWVLLASVMLFLRASRPAVDVAMPPPA
jgi:hypothetical protein